MLGKIQVYSKEIQLCIYMYPFSNSFPVLVITVYWAELPVLYSRALLVIYFKYESM